MRFIARDAAMNARQTLLAVALSSFAFAAAAQTVSVTTETGETETKPTLSTGQDGADHSIADQYRAERPQNARTCLRSTGSRIVQAQNQRAERGGDKSLRCAPAFGRVYSNEDLRRTGYVDISDALRSLDPAFR
jgi:hypothetical protein